MTHGSLLFVFPFLIINIHKHTHYIMKYDILILKYEIFKYFYNDHVSWSMGAAMFVRAESELWD